MRQAIVNATVYPLGAVPAPMFVGPSDIATSPDPSVKMPNQGHARMLPGLTNLSGGAVGRAASGTANGRDVARAGDFPVIARCLAIVGLAIGTLALSAPDLWPGLFGQ
jgi:hypothetical protein